MFNQSTASNPSPHLTANGAVVVNSTEGADFPPRHISGQCVHRWPSAHDPSEMVFYHQASRCQFSQLRGAPASAPPLYNPTSHSQHLGMVSPSPRPRNVHINHSATVNSLTRHDSLDSQQLFQTESDIPSSFNGLESHQSYQTPSRFNHQQSQISSPDESLIGLGTQAATVQPVGHGHMGHTTPSGFDTQNANNPNYGLDQSQTSHSSINVLVPETPAHRLISREIISRESSLPPSPSDLWIQRESQRLEPAEEPAASMTLDDPEVEEVLHDMWLKFVVHSRQGVDPTRGPAVAKNRAPKMFTHTFKARKFTLNINNYSFSELKEKLFECSNDMGKNSQGNSFIFKAAEATNSVKYIAYINSHEVYSKAADFELTSDADVEAFFIAVETHPKRTSGIDTLMEDPTKKQLEAEKNLSIGQHQLQARNINDNVATTTSDLAHATPEDPVDKALAALMLKYSTANNNNAEGWRVYKHDDVTKVMPMNFQLLGIWAEHMVKNPEVTVNVPPQVEGFEWTDLKKPVKMQTPLDSNSGQSGTVIGTEHTPPTIIRGTISEAQGYDITVDPYEVDRIRTFATMDDYMAFAGVRVGKVDEVVAILLDHDIERFDAFLYPEETGLEDLIEMGIQRGTAMRLMNCARRFYEYILSDELNNPKVPFDSSMEV